MDEKLYAKCSCQHCGTHIEFPLEAAGRTLACPHCQALTELSRPAPPVADYRPTAAEVVSAFRGSIVRPHVPLGYHAGLLLVTTMMIFLPLIYVLAVLALVGGIDYYAVHYRFLVESVQGEPRWYLLKLLAYAGPLFIGGVLVLFMVKPLFARRTSQPEPMTLNPATEPALFAFVAKICDTVGAPMPGQIQLDCHLNASASLKEGAGNFFGQQTVLTIGLPLVAGVNMQEFAGIIAPEFGHLTQGFGMRLSYVIRSINEWFARVAYERDTWDVWLDAWAEEVDDWRTMLVTYVTRLAIWLSRALLKLLMHAGHGVSCFLMRQMEYNADDYMIKVAGTETFEHTTTRLVLLGEASQQSYKAMREAWDNSRHLPDNFPAFLARVERQLTPEQRRKVAERMALSQASIFDTHPPVSDRMARARQADEPGIFELEQPATLLFTDFDAVAKTLTLRHYKAELGLTCDTASLQPADTMNTTLAKG